MLRPSFRSRLIQSLSILLIAFAATNASALSYAYVPEQIRLMTAEMIVVGTMGNVNQVGREITGTLTVTEVLKGKPAGKTIKMAWADLSQFGGGKGHQNGHAGVWILNKGRNGAYATGYPGNRIQADQTKRVKQSLKDIANIKWAEADGLAFSYVTEIRDLRKSRVNVPIGQPNPTAQLMIFPVVRNTSKKTIRVCDFAPDTPFGLKMKTPTGSKVTANLYPRASNQKINARFFRAVEPGQTLTLTYGMNVKLTEIGKYQLTMTYKNDRDGVDLKVDNAWTGELKTPSRIVATPGAKD